MYVLVTVDTANPPMKTGEIREIPNELLQPDSMSRLGTDLTDGQRAALIPWCVPLVIGK